MATNFPTLNVETRGSFVVMQKQVCLPTNAPKSIWNNLRMEWSCIIRIHVQNPLDILLVSELLFPKFASLDAILRFELPKKTSPPYCQPPLLCLWKKKSHIRNLYHNQGKIGYCCIEKLDCLNFKLPKQKGNKKHPWKKMKKNCHPKIKYLMPKGCFVQPFVKLGVKKIGPGEFFGLS